MTAAGARSAARPRGPPNLCSQMAHVASVHHDMSRVTSLVLILPRAINVFFGKRLHLASLGLPFVGRFRLAVSTSLIFSPLQFVS